MLEDENLRAKELISSAESFLTLRLESLRMQPANVQAADLLFGMAALRRLSGFESWEFRFARFKAAELNYNSALLVGCYPEEEYLAAFLNQIT